VFHVLCCFVFEKSAQAIRQHRFADVGDMLVEKFVGFLKGGLFLSGITEERRIWQAPIEAYGPGGFGVGALCCGREGDDDLCGVYVRVLLDATALRAGYIEAFTLEEFDGAFVHWLCIKSGAGENKSRLV
jgi:hypothetical protein